MLNILHRVGIKAPLNEVYRALATREGVAGWWTTDTQGAGHAGGVLKTTFTADGKVLGGFDLKVLELDPGKRVVWQVAEGPAEWVGTKIIFDLKQEDEFAIVLFKHEGWSEPVEFMSHCSTKWAVFLMSLKAYVETGKGNPSPGDVQISNWH
jgi:uncharacterized protein YndB with AHSA1/START domain